MAKIKSLEVVIQWFYKPSGATVNQTWAKLSLLIFYFILFFPFWVFTAACMGFASSCREQRPLSSSSVWASHCSGFPC